MSFKANTCPAPPSTKLHSIEITDFADSFLDTDSFDKLRTGYTD